jgi:hypothetical protein
MLIDSLSNIVTGLSWTQLCKDVLGGNPRQWSPAFKLFMNNLFINVYHKISGRSMKLWLGELDSFKQTISR